MESRSTLLEEALTRRREDEEALQNSGKLTKEALRLQQQQHEDALCKEREAYDTLADELRAAQQTIELLRQGQEEYASLTEDLKATKHTISLLRNGNQEHVSLLEDYTQTIALLRRANEEQNTLLEEYKCTIDVLKDREREHIAHIDNLKKQETALREDLKRCNATMEVLQARSDDQSELIERMGKEEQSMKDELLQSTSMVDLLKARSSEQAALIDRLKKDEQAAKDELARSSSSLRSCLDTEKMSRDGSASTYTTSSDGGSRRVDVDKVCAERDAVLAERDALRRELDVLKDIMQACGNGGDSNMKPSSVASWITQGQTDFPVKNPTHSVPSDRRASLVRDASVLHKDVEALKVMLKEACETMSVAHGVVVGSIQTIQHAEERYAVTVGMVERYATMRGEEGETLKKLQHENGILREKLKTTEAKLEKCASSANKRDENEGRDTLKHVCDENVELRSKLQSAEEAIRAHLAKQGEDGHAVKQLQEENAKIRDVVKAAEAKLRAYVDVCGEDACVLKKVEEENAEMRVRVNHAEKELHRYGAYVCVFICIHIC
jgi:chromosome segregation ATPase